MFITVITITTNSCSTVTTFFTVTTCSSHYHSFITSTRYSPHHHSHHHCNHKLVTLSPLSSLSPYIHHVVITITTCSPHSHHHCHCCWMFTTLFPVSPDIHHFLITTQHCHIMPITLSPSSSLLADINRNVTAIITITRCKS